MNEHPDIAELSAENLAEPVLLHLQECDVCSQIHADIALLNIELASLTDDSSVPAEIDKYVYEGISVRVKGIRQQNFQRSIVVSLSAVAAVVVLSFIIFSNLKLDKPVLADINGDGEVNVLDSLFLARKIDSQVFDSSKDLNEDGRLDGEDLQIVRNAVVNLDGIQP